MKSRVAGVSVALAVTSCTKVPIFDIEAGFSRADAAWFAEEDTLFFFYELDAEQGIGDETVIEITYATNDGQLPWTDIATLPSVHRHVPVDCGPTALCGSTSVHVPLEPRRVGIRMRYHRDGELALDADTSFNVVGPGPAHSHRSMVVYGVFDESNRRIQWRGRHQFPTLRNEEATELGLRRAFRVDDPGHGVVTLGERNNPYGYGVDCPEYFTPTHMGSVETDKRAVFHPQFLPVSGSTSTASCALATVNDATGTFTTAAYAQKNPEVRPAFPVLRSPIESARRVPFFLGPCDRTINGAHEEMQRQRLLIGDLRTTCIDDWADDGFAERLANKLTDAVEAARPAGDDMVLVIGLHRDEGGVVDVVEEALSIVVPEERHRSSPRLAGAFVFDSYAGVPGREELLPVVLWCPSVVPGGGDVVSAASLTCAIAPDNEDIVLGPLSFGVLPILPSRERYLDFVDTYSEAQAGKMLSAEFLVPRFPTTADHIDFGDFGVITFLNGERITADPLDAFSYCAGDSQTPVVFRSAFMQTDAFQDLVDQLCEDEQIPGPLCEPEELEVLTLDLLPQWHGALGETDYELGLFWDFPFLLRARFEAVTAGAVSAFGLSVPFGVAGNGQAYLGSQQWLSEEVYLDELLTQCTRFCAHPTFDSAGVYQVRDRFWPTYESTCYLPDYPGVGDGGFPRDP